MSLLLSHEGQPRDTPASLAVALALLAVIAATLWMATDAATANMMAWLPREWTHASWSYGYIYHFCFLAAALALIAILKPFFPGTFGLRWPKGKTYIGIALLSGLVMGPLMLVVDYWPDLIAHRPPSGPYGLDPGNVGAWLLMQGVFVGITEEVPFRSLMLGYMLTRIHGRVRIGDFDVSLAGVLMAVLFSLAHATSFWTEPMSSAIGQQIYVFAYGIFYAWLFERSGSIVAPIIAHNAGDFVEWSACFILRAAWG